MTWQWYDYPDEGGICIKDADSGSLVADLKDADYSRSVCEQHADLIAAAPDLLAACKRVLRAIRWGVTADRLDSEDQADILTAAINKAGGDE